MSKPQKEKESLPPHWEKVHGAIWLIGLAILFASGNFWPGILILVAVSGLAQAGIMAYVKRNQETASLESEREQHLPNICPNCGSPLNPSTVQWKGKQTAVCSYCGSSVKTITKNSEVAKEAA